MFKVVAVSFCVAAGTLSIAPDAVEADTLIMAGIDPANTAQTPERGTAKSAVANDWGEPINQREAVGEPPISSWEYPDFVVFFENDKVLHTVAKR